MLTWYAMTVTAILVWVAVRWWRAETLLRGVLRAAVDVCGSSSTTLAARLGTLRSALTWYAAANGWHDDARRLTTTYANHANAMRVLQAVTAAHCARCGEAIDATHGVRWGLAEGAVHLSCGGKP